MTTEMLALNEMLPDEAEAYFAACAKAKKPEDTSLAIIPIGSIEHHGPHMINGCDGYITLAKAEAVSRLSGGLLFPMISFSWEGATNVYSGGVGVREQFLIDYLIAVVRAVRSAGFKRIVIINSHGGNWAAMRAFSQHCLRETGIAVITVYGHAFCPEGVAARKTGPGEQGSLIAALHMLGRDDLVEDIREYTRKSIAEFGDKPKVVAGPPSQAAARKLGVVGQDYNEEIRHVQPDSTQLDPAPGIDIINKIAAHIVKHLPALATHVDETED